MVLFIQGECAVASAVLAMEGIVHAMAATKLYFFIINDYFLDWLINGLVKNAKWEPNVTSSDWMFCPDTSPKPKEIQFTTIKDTNTVAD